MSNCIPISSLDFEKGEIFLIDKPLKWTSFDVVKKVRNRLGIKKVGHAGTLDPLATGLLIVCAGKSTKRIDSFQALGKIYTGTLVLGKTTPSIDLETAFDSASDFSSVSVEMIENAAKLQVGDLMQIPPIYSAIKVDGQRAYKAARKKEEIKLQPRLVHISKFEITAIDLPQVHFKIECSKGTYIRSIVRDLGQALECGAHMSALRRTAIGSHKIENAYVLKDLLPRLQKDQ